MRTYFHRSFDLKHTSPAKTTIFCLQEVAQECQSMNWGAFKPLLADALIDHLQPIQVVQLSSASISNFDTTLLYLIGFVCSFSELV